MAYSTFRQEQNDTLLEPMFMGNSVNVARYDQQKHPIFEQLIEKQLSFFWRPEEIDVSKGHYITHQEFEAHTYKCVSEKGKLLVFTTGIRGGENYEDDTIRLKNSLA